MKSVNSFCAALRKAGEADDKPNRQGNQVTRLHHSTGRYVIDFADDMTAEGWLQFDTDQDAAYFGVWMNPTTRTTLCYAEGDWTVVDCPTVESYNAEVRAEIAFHGEGRIALVIETDGSAVELKQDRASQFFAVQGGAA